MKGFVFLVASTFGKCVVFLFTRHKVELVGGIGPTVGKVIYLDMIDTWIGCRSYEVLNVPILLCISDTHVPLKDDLQSVLHTLWGTIRKTSYNVLVFKHRSFSTRKL